MQKWAKNRINILTIQKKRNIIEKYYKSIFTIWRHKL